MRPILTIAAALALSVSASAGWASCGCPLTPLEGTYSSAGGPVLGLRHLDGSDTQCPTQVRITGKRQDAPDVDVTLTCKDGSWSGEEPSQLGVFLWSLTTPKAAPSVALDITETITVTLQLPAKLQAIGKKSRAFELSLSGKAMAPACLCSEVQAERDWAAKVQKAFGNKGLQTAAFDFGFRGKNSKASLYLDGNGQLQKFAKRSPSKFSYLDLIDMALEGDLTISPEGVQVQASAKPRSEAAEITKPRPAGELQKGAAASTKPSTCKISMPSDKVVAANCTPAIVLKAWRVHEEQHRKQCLTFQNKKVTTPDGKAKILLDDPLQTYNDESMPSVAFDAFNQFPAHKGAGEVAAYGAEIAVYDKWLKRYCTK